MVSAFAVLVAGTFMIVLGSFIVNVALPAMQADLHASASAIEWVVAGYGLAFATCLITAGRLEDRIGIRAITACGMVMGFAALGARLLGGLLMCADLGGLGWRTPHRRADP